MGPERKSAERDFPSVSAIWAKIFLDIRPGAGLHQSTSDVMAAGPGDAGPRHKRRGALQSLTEDEVVGQTHDDRAVTCRRIVYVPAIRSSSHLRYAPPGAGITPPVAAAASISFGAGVAIGAAIGGGGFVGGGFGGGVSWGFGTMGLRLGRRRWRWKHQLQPTNTYIEQDGHQQEQ